MRQLLIQVPQGCGKNVLQIAKACEGINLACWSASDDQDLEVVLVHVSNHKVGKLLEDLEELPDVKISLFPTGVMALHPPADQAAKQVKNVEIRSPIEIFLSGLQSVGSWKGFLAYAAIAGIVVWIGLYTNTVFLLTAAMLIAPFAGPAMTMAIATARGDRQLLQRSVIRYFAALGVAIAVAALLSWLLGQQIPTLQMIDTSQISLVAVLLPLAAGAAGAVNLIQSDRSSLVSGAATGMLVAASLAPPAGTVGMASAIGRWDLAINSLFLLLLQLVGINLSATLVFRLAGLTTQGARYQRGRAGVFPGALIVTLIALAGLLAWQFVNPPNLQRSTLAQQANVEVQNVIKQMDQVALVESNAHFTRANITGQNTLLAEVYVQRQPQATQSKEAIQQELTQAIQARLQDRGYQATPLVDVTVLEAPATDATMNPVR